MPCLLVLTRTKRPGKKSRWINDLNHQHQKELSRVLDKMQVVPLGTTRVKLSESTDYKNNQKDVQHKVNNEQEGILNWKYAQHKVNNQQEDIQNNVKIAESSKEECKNNTNNVVMIPSTIVVQMGKKIQNN